MGGAEVKAIKQVHMTTPPDKEPAAETPAAAEAKPPKALRGLYTIHTT